MIKHVGYAAAITRLAAVLLALATVCVTSVCYAQTVTDAAAAQKTSKSEKAGNVINRFRKPDAFPDIEPDPDRKLLEIWCPPITNSDCFILRYDGQVWIIDCSDEQWSRYAAQLINELGIKRIDRILVSHPHHDHLYGLPRIAHVADIGMVMTGFAPDTNEHSVALSNYCREKNIPITYFGDGNKLSMGDGVTVGIWMKGDRDWDLNNRSAVMKLTYGDRSMLFTGDIKQKGQKTLLEKVGPEALKSDILKYPHHGKEDLYTKFFKAVDPELVIVPSNHSAAQKAVKYLNDRHTDALYTPAPCIHLVTDGKKWFVEKMDFAPNPAFQSGVKVPFLKNYAVTGNPKTNKKSA